MGRFTLGGAEGGGELRGRPLRSLFFHRFERLERKCQDHSTILSQSLSMPLTSHPAPAHWALPERSVGFDVGGRAGRKAGV